MSRNLRHAFIQSKGGSWSIVQMGLKINFSFFYYFKTFSPKFEIFDTKKWALLLRWGSNPLHEKPKTPGRQTWWKSVFSIFKQQGRLSWKNSLFNRWTHIQLDSMDGLRTPNSPWTRKDLRRRANLPLEPSVSRKVLEKVRQLRDPRIFREGKKTFLLYSVAREHGIAIAKLFED